MKRSTKVKGATAAVALAVTPAVQLAGADVAHADAAGCDQPWAVNTCIHAVGGGHYFNYLDQTIHFETRYDGCLYWEINWDSWSGTQTERTVAECFHGTGTFTHRWRKNWQAPGDLYQICATMRRMDGSLQTGYACIGVSG